MNFELTLPIAGVSLNIFFLLGLGWMGGFLSGMLGVGGGVIITPALMVLGVPPMVAVASQVNHSIGTNLTGFLNYRRNNDVDFRLGGILLIGGIVGAVGGVYLLRWLNAHGQAVSIITISYIVVLAAMSFVLFRQSLKTLAHYRSATKAIHTPSWTRFIGLKIYFTRTRVELSVLFPLFVGIINGSLTSCLGVGNGIFMMPAISYLIGRTSPVVYGTTLLAGVGMSIITTFMYAVGTQSVDLFLVLILLGGGILGSQMGVRFGYTLPRPYIGMIGAFVILGICLRISWTANTGKSFSMLSSCRELRACPPNSLSCIMEFSQCYPIASAFVGVLGAILFSILLEYIFFRFSLISRTRRD
ncbi:MAG: sulfite exporter TauE/SafE family protein [Alphaproteobacteria bacterium]|jgi:uncharacterized membrane protein YfcA|nr:sulfite exporter TauE/SafE family protein [Alphaproteobacteria bacterium]